MEDGKGLNILFGVLITAVLLFSWVLSGYAAEKRIVGVTYYDDSADYGLLAEKALSKRIRNASTQANPAIIQTEPETLRNRTLASEYIECSANNDCGVNGTYVTNDFKCYEEDVYRQYIQYRCEKPATRDSRCVGTERNEFIRKCGKDEKCVQGDSFCAYEGDVESKESSWIAPNSTILHLTNEDAVTYEGYAFKAVYVISQFSKPRGLVVDVVRSDGSEEWVYLFYEKEAGFDDLRIGLKRLEKTGRAITADIWVNGIR